MGAHAVLMGTLIDYREETGPVKRSTKDGFQAYQVKVQDPANPGHMMLMTRYKPARYTEYYQENKVYCSFSYKLVSLETGEVLLSKVVDRSKDDHAWYATYDGDRNALFPARNGLVDTAGNARRDLMGLLNASREVKSVGTLGNDVLRDATQGMSGEVQRELASKLP
jgi:hypothetical protein